MTYRETFPVEVVPGPKVEVYEHQEVLDWVNEIRATLGKEPLDRLPRGYVGSSNHCVIARAIGDAKVGLRSTRIQKHFLFIRWEKRIENPPFVGMFIRHFDSWDYPELTI